MCWLALVCVFGFGPLVLVKRLSALQGPDPHTVFPKLPVWDPIPQFSRSSSVPRIMVIHMSVS